MKLETSHELLERVRDRHGASWYGLAHLLQTHKNTVYNWKGGHTIVDRRFAPRIAELLDESPEYVLLCLEGERDSDPATKKIWERIAQKFRARAASILLASCALAASLQPSPASANVVVFDQGAAVSSIANNTYYDKCRRWISRAAAWLGALLHPPARVASAL